MRKILKRLIIAWIIAVILSVSLGLISRYGASTTILQYVKDDVHVNIIGVAHIGMYWGKIQDILDSSDCVIYEAVPHGTGLEPVMEPYQRLARYAGVDFQGDALDYHSDWILSDITMDELLRFYPYEKITEFSDSVDSFQEFPSFLTRWIFGLVMLYASIFDKEDPLVTMRNEKPIREVIKQAEIYNNISVLYGELHLPGMGKCLEGYKLIGKKKLYIFDDIGSEGR